MYQQPLDVLGGISAEQFLNEYWQKKPLLVRNAMPEVIGLLEPDEIQQLALEDNITARLIQQQGKNHDQWQLKCSPLTAQDLQKLPPYWTFLVQALDHHSFDIAELWKKFFFLPQWRRDDVMISYASQGGSVGQHFDFYDVFLVQAYGQRRWQLGQICDQNTAFISNQPLKLLPKMEIWFDEVLNEGDLLYVPPCLSHYGVAENDCLTLSFGFRMPNLANMMDRTSDQFADQSMMKNPLIDVTRHAQPIGEILGSELDELKAQLIQQLQQGDEFNRAMMALMSEAKYPNNLPEADEIDLDTLLEASEQGYVLKVEPASRLLYRTLNDGTLEFWANGELLCLDEQSLSYFQALANGEEIQLDSQISEVIYEDILMAIEQSILILIEPFEDDE